MPKMQISIFVGIGFDKAQETKLKIKEKRDNIKKRVLV